MDPVKLFISDNLIKFVGFSEAKVVDFIIATAKKASSKDALLQRLQKDLEITTTDFESFSNALYDKFEHKAEKSASQIAKELHRQKVKELEKNAKFTLVEDEEDVVEPVKKKHKKEKREKKLRKKDKNEDAWAVEEEEEEVRESKVTDSKRYESQSEDDPEDERERDIRERDEFAQRLREKDLEREVNVPTFHIEN
jgi:pre-mRNA-splicing factor ATP-dependent RNA helicase DHX16